MDIFLKAGGSSFEFKSSFSLLEVLAFSLENSSSVLSAVSSASVELGMKLGSLQQHFLRKGSTSLMGALRNGCSSSTRRWAYSRSSSLSGFSSIRSASI